MATLMVLLAAVGFFLLFVQRLALAVALRKPLSRARGPHDARWCIFRTRSPRRPFFRSSCVEASLAKASENSPDCSSASYRKGRARSASASLSSSA